MKEQSAGSSLYSNPSAAQEALKNNSAPECTDATSPRILPCIAPCFPQTPRCTVPASPRTPKSVALTASSPLSTPRATRALTSNTTPPPLFRARASPFLRALQRHSLSEVRRALEEDPEAALYPFFEHSFEPPLCTSLRQGCNEDIVRLLLEYNASVEQMDVHGKTPLAILSAISHEGDTEKRRAFNIAKMLLDARADPLKLEFNLGGYKSCLDLALSAGNEYLVHLYAGDEDSAKSLLNDETPINDDPVALPPLPGPPPAVAAQLRQLAALPFDGEEPIDEDDPFLDLSGRIL